MNCGKRSAYNCNDVFAPVFQIGSRCKNPKILNVSGCIELPTMTWRWGFDLLLLDVNNSLGREQNACWLAGTAGVLGIAGNMLTISVLLSLLVALLLHFHPLISHQRLTWEMWGYNCVLLTIPTSSLSLSSLPGDWVWTCFKLPLFPLPLTILDILLFHLLIPTFFFPPPSSHAFVVS